MSDLISRQDAIDAVGNMLRRKFGIGGDLAEITLACLPSAQPLVKDSPSLVKDLVKDCISRQKAIEAVEHITSSMSVCVNTDECHGMKRMQRQAVIELANLPSAQPDTKAQLPGEGTTFDLISRQAAIEVIEEMQMPIMRSMFPEEQFVFKGMSEALSAIKDLPSAQPEIEERTEESAQNVPKEDLISRKAAIDYCYQLINVEHQQGSDEMNYRQERVNQTEVILHHLEFMPSAQPKREKGEWTKDCACEICGFKPWYERDIHTLSFCPNCGADMRGDDHDQSK